MKEAKHKSHRMPSYGSTPKIPRRGETVKTESRLVTAWGWVRNCLMVCRFPFELMKSSKIDYGASCTSLNILKPLNCIL